MAGVMGGGVEAVWVAALACGVNGRGYGPLNAPDPRSRRSKGGHAGVGSNSSR
jgi:hypothetical protein